MIESADRKSGALKQRQLGLNSNGTGPNTDTLVRCDRGSHWRKYLPAISIPVTIVAAALILGTPNRAKAEVPTPSPTPTALAETDGGVVLGRYVARAGAVVLSESDLRGYRFQIAITEVTSRGVRLHYDYVLPDVMGSQRIFAESRTIFVTYGRGVRILNDRPPAGYAWDEHHGIEVQANVDAYGHRTVVLVDYRQWTIHSPQPPQ